MLKIMKVANWIIRLVLVWSVTCIHLSIAQTTSTLSQYEGQDVTLLCSLSGTFTFPEWRGPPSLTVYTNLGDVSGTINPAAPAASRLEFASNNKSLILSDAVKDDSGDYRCLSSGLGDHTITLTINPTTTTTPDGFEWWKILLIVLGILMWNFLAGIGLGCSCFPKKNRNKKKGKCCCIIEGMPTWYKILWFTGIGTPVAFGIFCVLKCCKQGY